MKIEGNRVPDFFDSHGVLHTIHRRPHGMSQADYLEAGPVVNPNFDPSREPFGGVKVVEPINRVIDDCSPETMSDSVFCSHLEGDSEPIKVGSLEADLGVW